MYVNQEGKLILTVFGNCNLGLWRALVFFFIVSRVTAEVSSDEAIPFVTVGKLCEYSLCVCRSSSGVPHSLQIHPSMFRCLHLYWLSYSYVMLRHWLSWVSRSSAGCSCRSSTGCPSFRVPGPQGFRVAVQQGVHRSIYQVRRGSE